MTVKFVSNILKIKKVTQKTCTVTDDINSAWSFNQISPVLASCQLPLYFDIEK